MINKVVNNDCQVTSYGGSLRYTVQYLPGFDATPTDFPDVKISVSNFEIAAVCVVYSFHVFLYSVL